MKYKTILFLIFIFSIVEVFPAQYVRFEGGRELEIKSYTAGEEWITFNLTGGGTIGVRKEQVTIIGETEKDRVFIVSGKSVVSGERSNGKNTKPAKSASSSKLRSEKDKKADNTSTAGAIVSPEAESSVSSPDLTKAATKEISKDNQGDSNRKESSGGGDEEYKPISISILPSSVEATVGEEFLFTVSVSNVTNMSHASFYFNYDPDMIEVLSVNDGGFLSMNGADAIFLQKTRADMGQVVIGISRKGADVPGVSGSGLLASIKAKAVKSGAFEAVISKLKLKDASMQLLPFSQNTATVVISE